MKDTLKDIWNAIKKSRWNAKLLMIWGVIDMIVWAFVFKEYYSAGFVFLAWGFSEALSQDSLRRADEVIDIQNQFIDDLIDKHYNDKNDTQGDLS